MISGCLCRSRQTPPADVHHHLPTILLSTAQNGRGQRAFVGELLCRTIKSEVSCKKSVAKINMILL
jgi:hypothetical protein